MAAAAAAAAAAVAGTGGMAEAAEQVKFYTVLSPEERFIALRDQHPELMQSVPHKYLASYIGMIPTSFSRMKARVAEKGV